MTAAIGVDGFHGRPGRRSSPAARETLNRAEIEVEDSEILQGAAGRDERS